MATKLCEKNWLENKYLGEHKTGKEIADELGVSKHSVYRALKRHGIRVRKRTSKYPLLENKEWLLKRYWEDKLSLKAIAKEIGCSPGVVASHMKSKGIPIRPIRIAVKIAGNIKRKGEKAPNWRGGCRKLNTGYIYIYKPDHPNATKAGYVMEHILVAEKKLGRYLKPNEVVHHINHDKSDNRPENLMVLTRSQHVHNHFAEGEEVEKLKEEIAKLKEKLKYYEDKLGTIIEI